MGSDIETHRDTKEREFTLSNVERLALSAVAQQEKQLSTLAAQIRKTKQSALEEIIKAHGLPKDASLSVNLKDGKATAKTGKAAPQGDAEPSPDVTAMPVAPKRPRGRPRTGAFPWSGTLQEGMREEKALPDNRKGTQG